MDTCAWQRNNGSQKNNSLLGTYLLIFLVLTLGRTRKFIPLPWYKGPLPGVLDKLHYFEISPLVDGLGINKITSLALAPRQSGLKIHVLGSECVDVWWSCWKRFSKREHHGLLHRFLYECFTSILPLITCGKSKILTFFLQINWIRLTT